jgi:hypothetical protein
MRIRIRIDDAISSGLIPTTRKRKGKAQAAEAAAQGFANLQVVRAFKVEARPLHSSQPSRHPRGQVDLWYIYIYIYILC